MQSKTPPKKQKIKRILDFVLSLTGLIVVSPFFLLVAILIKIFAWLLPVFVILAILFVIYLYATENNL